MTGLALVMPTGPSADDIGADAAVEALAAPGVAVARVGRARVLVWPGLPCRRVGPGGLVAGPLFEGRRPVDGFAPAEREAIVESGGEALIERYWGAYVAVLPNGAGVRLLRAPFGDLALFVGRWRGLIVAVSHAGLFLQLPAFRPRIARDRLAAFVLDPRATARATGLAGIEELWPGEALDLPSLARTRRWRMPACRASRTPADLLTEALDTAVAGLAAVHPRLGVLLSGGLDSSILLGTLRHFVAPDRLVALHHHMPSLAPELDRLPESVRARPGLAAVAGSSDERAYAELAADQAGIELVVHRRRLEAFDLSTLAHAPLAPRPSSLAFRLDADAAETRFVASHGLSALVTGRGGDQVLYASTSPLTAADVVRARRWRPGWWRAVGEAAARSGLPLPTVAWLSLRDGLGRYRARRARLPASTSFLSEAGFRDRASDVEPWTDLIATLPPARAHQMGDLLDLTTYGENPRVPLLNPLLAQPVVEACLALPTFVLAEGGVSRGLARRAFAERVPAEIVARLHKAGGIGFIHRLVAARRPDVREMLLGGVLASAGLLDRERLAARLADGAPWREIEPIRLLDLVAVEAWARQWTARGADIA